MSLENCNFDSIPLAQSTDVRAPKLSNFNYTNQDFWSMKSRLVSFIKERFAEYFTDFVESSLAIMMMEIWAFIADTLSFKGDQIANEIFIDSMTEVDNGFRLSRLVGFQPTPPIPARASFSATISSILTTDLIIPTPISLPVSATTAINYELFPADEYGNPLLDNDIIIPAGSFINTAIVGVEGTTIKDVSSGDGNINQRVQLASFPVIFNSVRVDVDGVRWEQVEFFTDSNPRREYRIEYDSAYRAFVIFGNNRAGLMPSQGSTINILYRTGGGQVGNIVSNFINTQRNYDVEGLGISIPVTLENYTRGEFGYDGDGLEDIRRKLPAYIRTQNRAVTGEDYKTLADQFATTYNGQVGKATAVLRNYGCAGNIVDLFIMSKDGDNGLQESTDGLKFELEAELDNKKMITDLICIKNGSTIITDVTIDLVVDKFYRKFKEEIEIKVKRRVDNFFLLSSWDYGKTLKDTDLIKSVSDIKEISSMEVSFTTNDPDNSGNLVNARYYEIIRPDTTTISFTFV